MVQFSRPLKLALPSLYLAMRMSKVTFGRDHGFLPSIFFHWPFFWIFRPDHPRMSLLSYDDLFALGRLGLRWSNQNFLPIELDRIHVSREWIFVELHLWTLRKLQSSFVYGRLNLSTENIAFVSSMRIGILPFTICMLFQLLRRWYNMITWQFDCFSCNK
jgi:hypothetical protein